MLVHKFSWVAIALAITACSGEEAEEEQIDYASFDNAAVQALFDAGSFQQIHEIVLAQEQLSIADKDDYLMLADVYLALFNGIGAEVSVEKAVAAGAEDVEVALKLGRSLMIQRKFDAALAAVADVHLTGDDAYDALLLRGDIHRELNELDEARGFFNTAIKAQPDRFRGYLGLALLELNQGNFVEAEVHSSKAAEYVDEDPIVSYVRGTSARYVLRPEDAIAHLEKAIELHPAHLLANLELAGIYIDKQDTEKAQKYLDFVYGIAPDNTMAQYYSALILATEGKTEEAEELLLRTGDLTRQFPPAARVYGLVAFLLEKYSTAQPYLERFLAMVPEDRITRLALAESLTIGGEPVKALEVLSPLIVAGSDDFEANMQAAAAAGQSGDLIKALELAETAKILAEKNEEINKEQLQILERRLALTQFMTGNLERAADQLKALYSKDKTDITSLTLLANIQMESGDMTAAEQTLLLIMKVEPDKPLASNLLGAIRFRQGEIDKAIELYSRAITSNPEYLSALKNRGLAYVVSRQYEDALPDLEKLLAANPNDGQIHSMIGRTYLELGDLGKASVYLKLAENAFPRSAVILSDNSELLAEQGFISSAISKAKMARRYAGEFQPLVEYLDDRILTWETAETERKALAAEEEVKIRKELADKRAVKKKADDERRSAQEAEDVKRAVARKARLVAEKLAREKAESNDEPDV